METTEPKWCWASDIDPECDKHRHLSIFQEFVEGRECPFVCIHPLTKDRFGYKYGKELTAEELKENMQAIIAYERSLTQAVVDKFIGLRLFLTGSLVVNFVAFVFYFVGGG